MEKVTLNTEARAITTKGDTKRLREAGKIPAVAYRAGDAAAPFAIEAREFIQKASRSLSSQVFTLEGDSGVSGQALVKDIQRDGLTGTVTHVDFLLLKEGEPALVKVPVVVTGEAPGVKQQGGVLTVQCREITVKSPPESIPQEVVVSVEKLNLGDRISTGDLELPEKVELRSSPNETVANIISGRAARLAESEAKADDGAAAAGGEEAQAAA